MPGLGLRRKFRGVGFALRLPLRAHADALRDKDDDAFTEISKASGLCGSVGSTCSSAPASTTTNSVPLRRNCWACGALVIFPPPTTVRTCSACEATIELTREEVLAAAKKEEEERAEPLYDPHGFFSSDDEDEEEKEKEKEEEVTSGGGASSTEEVASGGAANRRSTFRLLTHISGWRRQSTRTSTARTSVASVAAKVINETCQGRSKDEEADQEVDRDELLRTLMKLSFMVCTSDLVDCIKVVQTFVFADATALNAVSEKVAQGFDSIGRGFNRCSFGLDEAVSAFLSFSASTTVLESQSTSERQVTRAASIDLCPSIIEVSPDDEVGKILHDNMPDGGIFPPSIDRFAGDLGACLNPYSRHSPQSDLTNSRSVSHTSSYGSRRQSGSRPSSRRPSTAYSSEGSEHKRLRKSTTADTEISCTSFSDFWRKKKRFTFSTTEHQSAMATAAPQNCAEAVGGAMKVQSAFKRAGSRVRTGLSRGSTSTGTGTLSEAASTISCAVKQMLMRQADQNNCITVGDVDWGADGTPKAEDDAKARKLVSQSKALARRYSNDAGKDVTRLETRRSGNVTPPDLIPEPVGKASPPPAGGAIAPARKSFLAYMMSHQQSEKQHSAVVAPAARPGGGVPPYRRTLTNATGATDCTVPTAVLLDMALRDLPASREVCSWRLDRDSPQEDGDAAEKAPPPPPLATGAGSGSSSSSAQGGGLPPLMPARSRSSGLDGFTDLVGIAEAGTPSASDTTAPQEEGLPPASEELFQDLDVLVAQTAEPIAAEEASHTAADAPAVLAADRDGEGGGGGSGGAGAAAAANSGSQANLELEAQAKYLQRKEERKRRQQKASPGRQTYGAILRNNHEQEIAGMGSTSSPPVRACPLGGRRGGCSPAGAARSKGSSLALQREAENTCESADDEAMAKWKARKDRKKNNRSNSTKMTYGELIRADHEQLLEPTGVGTSAGMQNTGPSTDRAAAGSPNRTTPSASPSLPPSGCAMQQSRNAQDGEKSPISTDSGENHLPGVVGDGDDGGLAPDNVCLSNRSSISVEHRDSCDKSLQGILRGKSGCVDASRAAKNRRKLLLSSQKSVEFCLQRNTTLSLIE